MRKILEVFHAEPNKLSPNPEKAKEHIEKILYIIFNSNAGKDLKEALFSGKFDPKDDSIMGKIKNLLKIKKKSDEKGKITIGLENMPSGQRGRYIPTKRRIEIAHAIYGSRNIFTTVIHELTHALQYHTETSDSKLTALFDSEDINKLMEAESRLKAAEFAIGMEKALNLGEAISIDTPVLKMLKEVKLAELENQGKDRKSASKEADIFAKTQFVQSVLIGGSTEILKKTLDGKIDLAAFEQANEKWRDVYDIQAANSSFGRLAMSNEVTFDTGTDEYRKVAERIANRIGIPPEDLLCLDLKVSQKEEKAIDDAINEILDGSAPLEGSSEEISRSIHERIVKKLAKDDKKSNTQLLSEKSHSPTSGAKNPEELSTSKEKESVSTEEKLPAKKLSKVSEKITSTR